MIDHKTLKEGDRIEIEIDAPKNTTITVAATYLCGSAVCLDEVLPKTATKAGIGSSPFLSVEKDVLDRLGLHSKTEGNLVWLLKGPPDNYACRIKRIIPKEPEPAWKAALPEGAVKTPILEAKLNDRVRIFLTETDHSTETDTETNKWVDATVLGSGGLIGWLPGETPISDTWGMTSTTSTSKVVSNITDYVRVGWLQETAACYILPDEVKPDLQAALKQVEVAVNEIAASLPEEQKTMLKTELDKLLKIELKVKSATENWTPVKDAQLGDTVLAWIDSAGYFASTGNGDKQVEGTVIAIGTTYAAIGFKDDKENGSGYTNPSLKNSVQAHIAGYPQKLADVTPFEFTRSMTKDTKVLIRRAEPVKDVPVSDKQIVPEKPVKQPKLSDAKLGDPVEVFISQYGTCSWVKENKTLKANVVGRIGSSDAVLAWNEKPTEGGWLFKDKSHFSGAEKSANFDDFKFYAQVANVECNILPPEPKPERIKLYDAKVGDRVRITTLGGWFAVGEQPASIDATIIGSKNSNILLGLNDKKDLHSVLPIDHPEFESAIKLDGAKSAFKYGRWIADGFRCEVLPVEPLPKKDGVMSIADVEIGKRVKVFYNSATGLLSSKETDHSFEATVVGSSVNILLGIKSQDYTGKVSAIKGMHYVSNKHIKVDNKSDFAYARWATRSAKCVVLPEIGPMSAGSFPLGAKVKLSIDLTGNWDKKATFLKTTEATIIGKNARGVLLGWKKGEDVGLVIGAPTTSFSGYEMVPNSDEFVRAWSYLNDDKLMLAAEAPKAEAPKAEAPKAEPQMIEAKDLKIGDRVKAYAKPGSSLSSANSPTDTIYEATVIRRRGNLVMLGWKANEAKPATTGTTADYAYLYSSADSAISNLDEYPRCWEMNGGDKFERISSLPSEAKPVAETAPLFIEVETGQANLGDRVKVFLTSNGLVAWERTDRSIEATVVGKYKGGNIILGSDDFGELAHSREMSAEIAYYHSDSDTLTTLPNSFKLGRLVAGNHKCVVMSPAKESVKDLTDLSSTKLNDSVEIFLANTGTTSVARTDSPIKGTVVGKTTTLGGCTVIGWKNGDTVPSNARTRKTYDLTFAASVPDYESYDMVIELINKVECRVMVPAETVVAPIKEEPAKEEKPVEEAKEEAKVEEVKNQTLNEAKIGDTVELFVSSRYNHVVANSTSDTIKTTIIGKTKHGNLICGVKDVTMNTSFAPIVGFKPIPEKASDFDSYVQAVECGVHVVCRILPPEPKKADIGGALMLLGAIVGAGISTMMAPRSQVRVAEVPEELAIEDIETQTEQTEGAAQ